jgi:hypothetical protein
VNAYPIISSASAGARTEKAAASENDWVRARILKQDPPVEGSLLKVAERARDMSTRSLGNQHPAYAVALQNLGLYYDAIENDGSMATEFFAQARASMITNFRWGMVSTGSVSFT